MLSRGEKERESEIEDLVVHCSRPSAQKIVSAFETTEEGENNLARGRKRGEGGCGWSSRGLFTAAALRCLNVLRILARLSYPNTSMKRPQREEREEKETTFF